MRERKFELKPRRDKALPPEKLYVILRGIYPKEAADDAYRQATGLEPPEADPKREL